MLSLLPASAHQQSQLAAFALAALAATCAAAALALSGAGVLFQPYLGSFHPTLALSAASLVGVLSLRVLQYCCWFDTREGVGQSTVLAGLGIAAACATLLAAPVIAVDARFGIDVTNVAAPTALLFYPSIALVVEAVFHLAPLALLFAGLRSFAPAGRAALAGIAFVSLLEPCYQAGAALADQTLSALETYVWVQVWAVNLVQLLLFRRFGFGSMYAMRLVYYLWWHVVWAAFR